MKIKIGNYPDWIGPYQIAEKICFWMDKYEDDRVHAFGEFLAHGFAKKDTNDDRMFTDDRPKTWLYKLCEWIHSKKNRTVKIHLDRWDTWNMDSTLALIVLPMLKQLKETNHGSPFVDDEDLPDYLRLSGYEDGSLQKNLNFGDEEQYKKESWDLHAKKWDWVMDELIWTFEQLQPDCDWEDQYFTGNSDFRSKPIVDENGKVTMYEMIRGPNDTRVTDWDGLQQHQERINNGLRLFGKYYTGLWD